MRIAIVDDEELARKLLREYLASCNDVEIVAECANGFEAVKAVTDLKPDLLLLDIHMPRLDGFEVLRRIQKLDKHVPVVAITAAARPAEREKALKAGFCDYFVKPILEIERFRATVYSHIGKCVSSPVNPPDSEQAA